MNFHNRQNRNRSALAAAETIDRLNGNYLTYRILRTFSGLRVNTDAMLKTVVTLAVLTTVVLAILMWGRCQELMADLRETTPGRLFMAVGLVLVIINLVAFAWRVVLVNKYTPSPTCGDAQLPTCTVVVPAFNEGQHVLNTIRSIIASDYPAEKLSIIAIDDGSADDTWTWLRQAANEFPKRVEIYGFLKNRGKKHALAEGIKLAKGEIIVTVDSDSVVETQAIRNLVSPFVHDKQVGGVAGNIRVLNAGEGWIPRMLDVNFAFSFDFVRASESMTGSVLCTPGALSAYRRAPLVRVLGEWLRQTFNGKPAIIGEDRAITNLLLREGYFVKFQSNAVAYTKVPTRYKGLCKMLIRWARSNVRESLVMNTFIFSRFRKTSLAGTRINHILSWIDMTVTQVMILGMVGCLWWQPTVYGVQVLLGSAISGAIPAIFFIRRHRNSNGLWAFPYSVYYMAALAWIMPYSIVTVGRDGWLTRTIRKPATASVPAKDRLTATQVVAKPAA